MVQGLAFLSKKSWHTKNIANQEKVWIAEQREQAEKQKTAELAKTIQQEREDEELSKIAGHTKSLDRGINWMYDGQCKQSETAKEDAAKEAEEYLLGKEYRPTEKIVGDLDATAQLHQGVNAVVLKDVPNPNDVEEEEQLEHRRQNEAFRMRHEDPMFAVSMKAYQNEKSAVQRKELYERAGIKLTEVVDEKNKDSKKRHMKRERKEKKKRKKHHRSDRESEDDDDDSYNRHRSHKSRKRTRLREPSSRRRSQSVDSYSSYSSVQNPDVGHRYREQDRHRCDHRRRDDDDRKPPPDSNYHQHRTHNHESNSLEQSQTSIEPSSKRLDRNDHDHDRKVGYGLQGKRHEEQIDGLKPPLVDLGPDAKLLECRRQERELERRRLRDLTQKRRPITTEEREAVLLEYQQDATRHAMLRQKQSHRSNDTDNNTNRPRNATFLHEMTKQVHGIQEGQSMSERLRQNRSTNQRLQDKFL